MRISSYLINVEGTVNMPIALESLVLAGIYTGMEANMLMESLV